LAILGGILLVVLASFVIAYFASRTWHWVYVMVVVGIVLFTAGFFILSAEVLRVNAIDRSNYNKIVADLEKVTAQVEALKRGTLDATIVNQLRGMELKMPEDATEIPSVSDLDHEIRLLTQVRGPVWSNVTPAAFDQRTGAVRVSIASPTPSGLAPNTVLYVFEQGDVTHPDPQRGKQYLGEFRVTEAAGQEAMLIPALELSTYQLERLGSSQAPWVMYETMPLDQHKLFSGLTEEQLRQKLPAASVEEYLRHGKATNADDEAFRKAGYDDADKRLGPDQLASATRTEYRRRLRDYALEFRELSERRAVLQTAATGLELDNRRLAEAAASAERLSAFRQDEAGKLNSDLAGLQKDRQAVDRLLTMVRQQLDTIRRVLDETLQENNRLVRELAALQSAAESGAATQAAAPASPGPLGQAAATSRPGVVLGSAN